MVVCFSLLEEVLERLEQTAGELLVATLCLLEVSATGLQPLEIRQILGADRNTTLPDLYEEKGIK